MLRKLIITSYTLGASGFIYGCGKEILNPRVEYSFCDETIYHSPILEGLQFGIRGMLWPVSIPVYSLMYITDKMQEEVIKRKAKEL